MIRTAVIICNVGGILFSNESTYWALFLARMSDGQYFLVVRKPAATIEGVAYPEGFGLITKENLANGTHNVPAFIVSKLAVNTYFNFTAEMENFARFKTSVFNETAIIALTTTVRGLTSLSAVPAAYTIKGATTAQSVVDELAGNDELSDPVNTGTDGFNSIVKLPVNLPEFQNDPLGAVTALFGKPLDYAKANPVSTGVIIVGGLEIGSMLGLWKFSPLKKLGLKKGR